MKLTSEISKLLDVQYSYNDRVWKFFAFIRKNLFIEFQTIYNQVQKVEYRSLNNKKLGKNTWNKILCK